MTTPKIIEDGDIFRSRAQTLVNTVNCVGVMGKGIALGFKRRFPEMYDDYVARCERGEVKLGRPYLYRYVEGPWILNFPTKDHWRGRSQLGAIETGLRFLASNYEAWGISSLAVPPLGAGNGGLEWHVVGPTLFRYLNEMDIPIELYVPYGTPHAELQPEFAQTSLTEGPELVFDRIGPDWVALLVALERLERQPYRPRIGRTLFQKLAYFGSQAGLNLGLGYGRASYGPFSPDLKSAITHLENNGLITEEKRGRMFVIRLGSTFASAEQAMGQALAPYEPMIDKLVDLFARLRTAPEAEVAASVHFAWSELERSGRQPTEEAIVQAVMEWKARRQPKLDPEVVAQATRGLNLLGWIRAQPSKSLLPPEPDLAALRA
jgi:O-acetyl-ADP-ribose deacetylase (regulator of RNase III)